MPRGRTKATGSKPINLALQGGGAHGAFAWGALDRLLEDGRLAVDGVSATSAGAMNAVVLAYGLMLDGRDGARAYLETFWQQISAVGRVVSPIQRTPWDLVLQQFGFREPLAYHWFETATRMLSPYQFNPTNQNPLRDVLTAVVDFEALRAGGTVNLRISATNVRSGGLRVFSTQEVTPEAVLASACLPMLFQAVEIDGEHYWDGGYMGNPAIFPLIYHTDTQDVLIVHINPIRRPELPTMPGEIYNRINEISFNSSLVREMRAINFVTKLIDDDWLKPEHAGKLKRMRIHAIRSDADMAAYSVASKFETDWDFLTTLRDLGRVQADAWLAAHFDRVGVESSVDLQTDYLT